MWTKNRKEDSVTTCFQHQKLLILKEFVIHNAITKCKKGGKKEHVSVTTVGSK
jgi:hypothetical protein